jgi:hypothetical protein
MQDGIAATIEMEVRCAVCVSCGLNMRETDGDQTTDRCLLLYGKIFSHRAGTGLPSCVSTKVREEELSKASEQAKMM